MIVIIIVTHAFSFAKSANLNISEKEAISKSIQDSLETDLNKDRLPSLKFLGNETSELYSREIDESFKGVLKLNFISTQTEDYPIGFVRASIPKYGWWETFWTRDGGTFSTGTGFIGGC